MSEEWLIGSPAPPDDGTLICDYDGRLLDLDSPEAYDNDWRLSDTDGPEVSDGDGIDHVEFAPQVPTPGPWEVREGWVVNAAPAADVSPLAVMQRHPLGDWEANARLMAAGPELADIARRVVQLDNPATFIDIPMAMLIDDARGILEYIGGTAAEEAGPAAVETELLEALGNMVEAFLAVGGREDAACVIAARAVLAKGTEVDDGTKDR